MFGAVVATPADEPVWEFGGESSEERGRRCAEEEEGLESSCAIADEEWGNIISSESTSGLEDAEEKECICVSSLLSLPEWVFGWSVILWYALVNEDLCTYFRIAVAGTYWTWLLNV